MLTRATSLVYLIFGVVGVLAEAQEEGTESVPPTRVAPDVVTPPADQSEGPKAPPAPSDQADAPTGKVPSKLLGALSNDKYRERLSAQESLLEWGMKDLDGSIDLLYGVYRRADDPEVRLRSREVLKRLVIVKQPFEGDGYLGIQMEPAQWKNPQGQLQPVVRITVVREGTAAEVAKLKMDDLVTGVDQVVFDDLAPTQMFADYIKSKKPGDVIALHLQRGEAALTLKATLRRRSPLLNQLNQWGTQLILPDQAELDEGDFQDWLKMRGAAESGQSKGKK